MTNTRTATTCRNFNYSFNKDRQNYGIQRNIRETVQKFLSNREAIVYSFNKLFQLCPCASVSSIPVAEWFSWQNEVEYTDLVISFYSHLYRPSGVPGSLHRGSGGISHNEQQHQRQSLSGYSNHWETRSDHCSLRQSIQSSYGTSHRASVHKQYEHRRR